MPDSTQIKLTIGIPTYNFGRFIGETLDAFIKDLPDGVEILVVDGNSSDDTEEVVARRAVETGSIQFVRLEQRGGIDADVLRTMQLARGDYVWLFSADDVAFPGAVGRVLADLKHEPDVLILAHTGCTIDMQLLQDRYPIVYGGDVDMRIITPEDREQYLMRAKTSEAFFSFLSGLVVRKSAWDAATVPNAYFSGSCWGHAARLLSVMRDRGLHIVVRTAPLLSRRGDNDSFLTSGLVARFALAIDGYRNIFADLFGPGSPEAAQCRRVLRNEFKLKAFLMTRLRHAPHGEDWDRLQQLFDSIYGNSLHHRFYRLAFRHLPLPAIAGLACAKGVWTRLRR